MFRKFQDNGQSNELDDDDDMGLFASRPDLVDASPATSDAPPSRRSPVGPRVLFPTGRDIDVQVNNADEEAEEATTDIEDHVQAHEAGSEDPHEDMSKVLEQPVKAKHASVRSLRHRPKHERSEHDGAHSNLGARKKHASPFDGWLRKKGTPTGAISKSKKRDSDTFASPSGPAVKKTRGSRTTAESM